MTFDPASAVYYVEGDVAGAPGTLTIGTAWAIGRRHLLTARHALFDEATNPLANLRIGQTITNNVLTGTIFNVVNRHTFSAAVPGPSESLAQMMTDYAVVAVDQDLPNTGFFVPSAIDATFETAVTIYGHPFGHPLVLDQTALTADGATFAGLVDTCSPGGEAPGSSGGPAVLTAHVGADAVSLGVGLFVAQSTTQPPTGYVCALTAADIANIEAAMAADGYDPFIDRLYCTFFGRQGDGGGLKYWSSQGMTRDALAQSFVNVISGGAAVSDQILINIMLANGWKMVPTADIVADCAAQIAAGALSQTGFVVHVLTDPRAREVYAQWVQTSAWAA